MCESAGVRCINTNVGSPHHAFLAHMLHVLRLRRHRSGSTRARAATLFYLADPDYLPAVSAYMSACSDAASCQGEKRLGSGGFTRLGPAVWSMAASEQEERECEAYAQPCIVDLASLGKASAACPCTLVRQEDGDGARKFVTNEQDEEKKQGEEEDRQRGGQPVQAPWSQDANGRGGRGGETAGEARNFVTNSHAVGAILAACLLSTAGAGVEVAEAEAEELGALPLDMFANPFVLGRSWEILLRDVQSGGQGGPPPSPHHREGGDYGEGAGGGVMAW